MALNICNAPEGGVKEIRLLMHSLIKWSVRTVLAILALVLLGLFVFYLLLSRSIAEYDYDAPLRYGSYEAEIIRDINAIPHIYAKEERDAFFALGFAHAQDRLWQMILARAASQGRLSEIFGPDLLANDRYMRALDLWRLAGRNLRELDYENQVNLQAYADGVNAYILEINKGARGAGAPEFMFFGRKFTPWVPTDSLAVLKLVALQISSSASKEISRAVLSAHLELRDIEDLFYQSQMPSGIERLGSGQSGSAAPAEASISSEPPSPSSSGAMRAPEPRPVVENADISAINPINKASWIDRLIHESEANVIHKALSPLTRNMLPRHYQEGVHIGGGASNAFIASPERSAGKAPLLASDPHLPFSAPSRWTIAHLAIGDRHIYGGSFPGIPAILIGHNRNLAWGLTTSYLDDQDVVILRRSEGDGTKYQLPEGEGNIASEEINIKVRGGADERFIREVTKFGPVIPPNGPLKVERVLQPGHSAALSWTALGEEDHSMEAAFAMMRAKNVDEGIKALSLYTAPAQIFSLADAGGNIAQIAAGTMPKRAANNRSEGRFPAASWIGPAGFSGLHPPSAAPKRINPEDGLLLHTNNKFLDQRYPEHFSFDWGDSYRILRAKNKLGPRQYHTLSSFTDAQNDTISEAARINTRLIARSMWSRAGNEPRMTRALELLANWNGAFDELRPEPLIYSAWMEELNAIIFSDELGPLYSEVARVDALRIERIMRNIDDSARWCDIIHTEAKESCDQIAETALERALSKLSNRYGNDIEHWRWGVAHMAEHKNQVLSAVPILGLMSNIRQAQGGSGETLLRGVYQGGPNLDFTSRHGAGLRMVVDFADLDHSKIIISTGMSGHIFSTHYDDLSRLWRNGEYLDMTTRRQLIEANQIGRIEFRPK